MELYTIYAVKFGSTVQGSVTAFQHAEGANVVTLDTDGDVDAQLVSLLQAAPEFTFDLADVVAGLGFCTATGNVGAGNINTLGGATFYLSRMADAGRASGSNHITWSVANGIVVPATLNLQQGQAASLGLIVAPLASAGTDPVVVSAAGSLASVTATGGMWTLGGVSLNGTLQTGVQSASMAFGYTIERGYGDGAPFPKNCRVITKRPVAQVTQRDAAVLGTLTAAGVAATSAALWIRKVNNNGMPDANAAETHYRLLLNQGLIARQGAGGSMAADVRYSITGSKESGEPLVELEGPVAIA